MKFVVQLIQSEEGFSVSAPARPGCHSQGDTREEALANIADAIGLYLEFAPEFDGATFDAALVDVDLSHAEAAGH